jgi:hypothetical protein
VIRTSGRAPGQWSFDPCTRRWAPLSAADEAGWGLLPAPTPARVAGAASAADRGAARRKSGPVRSRASGVRCGHREQLEAGAAGSHVALARRVASPSQSRGQQGGRAGDAEGRTVTIVGAGRRSSTRTRGTRAGSAGTGRCARSGEVAYITLNQSAIRSKRFLASAFVLSRSRTFSAMFFASSAER